MKISKAPESLAKYCDALLRKNDLSEVEREERMSQSLILIKAINNKDVFERFYLRMFAQRLIQSQTHSMDAEDSMICRLQGTCGYEFINKLHRMFNDASISSDLNSQFREVMEESGIHLGVNSSIQILQSCVWPIGQNIPSFTVPPILEKPISEFEMFYANEFGGRRVKWLHGLCTAEVKFLYLEKTYVANMNNFQMAILLLFEKQNSLSMKEIQTATQLQEQELSRQVKSLVAANILLVEDDASTHESSICVSLNLNYTNKSTKFRIPVPKGEIQEEVKKMHVRVEEDRTNYLQALIIRIMKSHKRLQHSTLIREVISQASSHFTPSESIITKCIKLLISRDYMEYVEGCTDVYNYI